jgi:hypothetical protein
MTRTKEEVKRRVFIRSDGEQTGRDESHYGKASPSKQKQQKQKQKASLQSIPKEKKT